MHVFSLFKIRTGSKIFIHPQWVKMVILQPPWARNWGLWEISKKAKNIAVSWIFPFRGSTVLLRMISGLWFHSFPSWEYLIRRAYRTLRCSNSIDLLCLLQQRTFSVRVWSVQNLIIVLLFTALGRIQRIQNNCTRFIYRISSSVVTSVVSGHNLWHFTLWIICVKWI